VEKDAPDICPICRAPKSEFKKIDWNFKFNLIFFLNN
jgi:hypothetical protein